ncbi:MAG: BON domain-containing protein [Chitinophagaceae bacterium]
MKKLLVAVALLTASYYLPACKSGPKDADIKTEVEAALATEPGYAGVSVAVAEGVVTVNGEVADPGSKSGLQSRVESVKGVKSVKDNTSVAAPPPPAEPVIAADDPLTKGVNDAIKDYPGVTATVNDGVISLSGEIKSADWKKLKKSLDGLRPKKTDPTGLKIK